MNYKELKEKLKDVPVPKVVQDQEPDMASYCKEIQSSPEFKTEYDEFLASVRGE